MFLSQTNPAVDNLKRRVTAASCTFSTITRFLTKRDIRTNYDLLVIDECSTVSNSDMKKVLEKATFQLLLLVVVIHTRLILSVLVTGSPLLENLYLNQLFLN